MATKEVKGGEAKLNAHRAREQGAPVSKPDEARMSEIAKRLLATPPEK